jgi:transposase
MDAIEQMRQDFRSGRISVDRLFDVLASLQRQLQTANQQLQAANQRLEVLEKNATGAGSTKLQEAFSLRAEEKRAQERQQGGGKKRKRKAKANSRRGRFSSADKLKNAERIEKCFPEGVPPEESRFSHARPVWRLENGRAILVAYHIYRGPKNQYGKIPGVLGRSEFGLEIVVEIAHCVYMMGLSLDKVCQLLGFMQQLHLKKSQADALLYQLARHWEQQFDVLCTLLANSWVVHADETSWSINSVWAFLSEKARVLLFGVHKDGATLEQLLDPQTFQGLVISDDAAVYGHFSNAQKCWAHLLRKAIKLTLQEPNHWPYRRFTDGLLAIYRRACRVRQDGRLSDAGCLRKIADLEDELEALCAPDWDLERPPQKGLANDYRLLVNEVMRLLLEEQLFSFVTAYVPEQPNGVQQPLSGTNNEAERTLRGPAQARDTGRTNKSVLGARRQSILVSVLESLRLYLPCFTLRTVIDEVRGWYVSGQSCFRRLLKQMKLQCRTDTVLDKVLPIPDG